MSVLYSVLYYYSPLHVLEQGDPSYHKKKIICCQTIGVTLWYGWASVTFYTPFVTQPKDHRKSHSAFFSSMWLMVWLVHLSPQSLQQKSGSPTWLICRRAGKGTTSIMLHTLAAVLYHKGKVRFHCAHTHKRNNSYLQKLVFYYFLHSSHCRKPKPSEYWTDVDSV